MNNENQIRDNDEQRNNPTDDQEMLEQEIRNRWEPSRDTFEREAAEMGEAPGLFDELLNDRINYERIRFQVERANADLQEDAIPWGQLASDEIVEFSRLLANDPDESTVHRFLEEHRQALVTVIGGGKFRCQISKQRLGAEFVPDFLLASQDSMGVYWQAVELESSRTRSYRRDGRPNSQLHHAIEQIRDWRRWLRNNRDYARRSREDHGLGLVGIDERVPGLVLIGRRSADGQEYPNRYNEFRRDVLDRERIAIHSYDWLLEIMQSGRMGLHFVR